MHRARATVSAAASPDAAFWTLGFRPFFFLAGVWGAVAPLTWVAMLEGVVPPPAWLTPSAWHAHEMVFGWVVAAIAGFLLTAVPNWTSTKPVAGRALIQLAALWTAGRLAMLASGVLPPVAVAAIDVAFVPALAVCLVRPLASTRQRRNWAFVPILLALCAANAILHAQALGIARPHASITLRFAIGLIVLLIVVIGGRITPAFTRNAFVKRGVEAAIPQSPWRDRVSIVLVALVAVFEVGAPRTHWSGAVALLAALAVASRMHGWQTIRARHDPLLWSLHAGYAWVAIGLALVGVGDLTLAIPPTAGLHALTAGAMGSMILAVMTRVGLGHTGRPLVAPRGIALAYAMVHIGALARVASVFPVIHATAILIAAAALWSGGFALFVAHYGSILFRPRVGGSV